MTSSACSTRNSTSPRARSANERPSAGRLRASGRRRPDAWFRRPSRPSRAHRRNAWGLGFRPRHRSPLTAHRSPLTAHRSPLTA
ncbi:hypothetical protein E5U26_36375, partial [Burkholderia pseudomallei]|nr:hypothetical protein [Burkholderia pseudomallei]